MCQLLSNNTFWIEDYMIILEEDFEKLYYDRTSDFFNLAIEYGEIINQYQDKVVALQQENKRLKREIWNLKKTKGKRK